MSLPVYFLTWFHNISQDSMFLSHRRRFWKALSSARLRPKRPRAARLVGSCGCNGRRRCFWGAQWLRISRPGTRRRVFWSLKQNMRISNDDDEMMMILIWFDLIWLFEEIRYSIQHLSTIYIYAKVLVSPVCYPQLRWSQVSRAHFLNSAWQSLFGNLPALGAATNLDIFPWECCN